MECDVAFVQVDALTKSHGERILWQVSFEAIPGEIVAVQGPSGAGKTSLLSVLGLLSKPTSGRYLLGGNRVDDAPASRGQELRASTVTSIFQQGNVFAHLTESWRTCASAGARSSRPGSLWLAWAWSS
jgi:ABC-type lipoprotein export system ATPase subunit